MRLARQVQKFYSQQPWVGRPKQAVGAASHLSPKTLFASTLVVAAKPNLTNQLMRISDASQLKAQKEVQSVSVQFPQSRLSWKTVSRMGSKERQGLLFDAEMFKIQTQAKKIAKEMNFSRLQFTDA